MTDCDIPVLAAQAQSSAIEQAGAPMRHEHITRHDHEAKAKATRPMRSALLRGWRRRCPRCGRGALLKGYLKVGSSCPVCKLDYSHHRADDGPAYLTILLVGHLMAPLLHFVFVTWRPEPLILFTIFAVGCVGLSLYLLPRLKGAIVGFQWARAMGGFDQHG